MTFIVYSLNHKLTVSNVKFNILQLVLIIRFMTTQEALCDRQIGKIGVIKLINFSGLMKQFTYFINLDL